MKKRTAFDWIINISMGILMLIILYPIYFTVIASFSDPYAVAKGKVLLYPVGLTLESYQHAFAYKQIWVGYANSMFYTLFGTAFSVALTIPAAYGLSKKQLPGRFGLTCIFLVTMYFGGGLIPTYLLVKGLHLLNTRLVLIILSGMSVYNMVVARVYFSTSIPGEIYEAARIDGASELRIFFTIALPLAVPIIAVIALYYSVANWNSYFNALVYITNEKLEPLQIVLRRVLIMNENAVNEALMQTNSVSTEQIVDKARRSYIAYTMKYSMVLISSLPMLILYPFLQRYFVKGLLIGSLKG